jgi:hypothetical protein
MKSPKEERFINPGIYFQTYSSSTREFSKEKYATYDEARKIVDEDRIACEQKSIESDLSVSSYENPERHYKIVGELIKSYRNSGKVIQEAMVVRFQQTKEYQILPNAELTPALWLKKPYVTYGPVQDIEKVAKRYQGLNLLDKSSFKANEY